MNWSSAVRHYRRVHCITQDQLADIFAVDTRTVRRWESGQSIPPMSVRDTVIMIDHSAQYDMLAKLTSSSTEIMCLFDQDRRIIAASPALLQSARLSVSDVVGANYCRLFVPEHATGIIDRIDREGGYVKSGLSGFNVNTFRSQQDPNGVRVMSTRYSQASISVFCRSRKTCLVMSQQAFSSQPTGQLGIVNWRYDHSGL